MSSYAGDACVALTTDGTMRSAGTESDGCRSFVQPITMTCPARCTWHSFACNATSHIVHCQKLLKLADSPDWLCAQFDALLQLGCCLLHVPCAQSAKLCMLFHLRQLALLLYVWAISQLSGMSICLTPLPLYKPLFSNCLCGRSMPPHVVVLMI